MKLIILYFIANDIKLVSEKLTTPISILMEINSIEVNDNNNYS